MAATAGPGFLLEDTLSAARRAPHRPSHLRKMASRALLLLFTAFAAVSAFAPARSVPGVRARTASVTVNLQPDQVAKKKPSKGPLGNNPPDFAARRAAMEARSAKGFDLSEAQSTLQGLGLSLAFLGVVVAYKINFLDA